MKKTLLISVGLLLTGLATFAQNVNIPDANFKTYLLGNNDINTNGDTEIQVSEASAYIGTINCGNQNIFDLTGIEAFTSLNKLFCSNNNLSTINLSQNTALTELNFQNNSLTDIDLSQNTALTVLNCSHNNLSSLDVTQNTALLRLFCNNNNLNNTIDLTQNVNLTRLICLDNNLTSIDVSNAPNFNLLSSGNNALTSLNVANGNNANFVAIIATGNPNLTCIEVDDVAYSTANWTSFVDATASFSTNCTNSIVNIPDANFKANLVGNSAINTNGDTEIQVTEANSFAGEILCVSQNISDLTGIEAFVNITKLDCRNNNLTNLNVSQNVLLTELLCTTNSLTSIDLSQNTALITLSISANNLTTLDLSQNTALVTLFCSQNSNLSTLDVSQNVNLEIMTIDGTDITSINLSQNTALEQLNINQDFTSLDISNNTALIELGAISSNLTSLNVSNNIALESLVVSHSNIASLDVSQNVNLTSLQCNNINELTQLNLKNLNPNQVFLNATNTPNLTCIEVDDVTDATANWTNIDATASFSTNCTNYIVNIPDANFKAYLVGNSAINTNSDTEIQVSEATAFSGTINCNNLGISDLTGIEAFTSLNALLCADNTINSIDLSSNTLLWGLNLLNNPIGSIDLSSCSILYSMNVSNCNLTTLDVSNNPELIEVYCWDNSITSLDLSQNPNLQQLACQNNDLTMLNMTNISTTTINFFNATGNPNLTCIEVDNVADATANWTNIDATASFSLDCNALSINEFELAKSISIYPNPAESQIHLNTDENIEYVTVVDIFGKTIKSNLNDYTTIDISNLSNGIYFLYIHLDKGIIKKKFIKQ